MTTPEPRPFAPLDRKQHPPMTARRLAEKLLEHPDADVQLMVPQQFSIIGQMFFGNEDHSQDTTHPNGVFLLALNLGGFLDEQDPDEQDPDT
jgi:hypothetical protein